jgi:hypothetical protein
MPVDFNPKKNLAKAVWKVMLAANEIELQNRKRSLRNCCCASFFFTDHYSLGTFHFIRPFSPATPFSALFEPLIFSSLHINPKSKFLAVTGSPFRSRTTLFKQSITHEKRHHHHPVIATVIPPSDSRRPHRKRDGVV